MFLVYLSQGLHAPFFVHVWHYGDRSRVNPVELSIALFGVFSGAGWFSVTFYVVLLMFNHWRNKSIQRNIKNDTDLNVYPSDEGSKFFIMKQEEAI